MPALNWARSYDRGVLGNDLVAAVIVASILLLCVYAMFGTSRTLSVGPVAEVSLMTAAAVSQVAAPGASEYLAAALLLALVSAFAKGKSQWRSRQGIFAQNPCQSNRFVLLTGTVIPVMRFGPPRRYTPGHDVDLTTRSIVTCA